MQRIVFTKSGRGVYRQGSWFATNGKWVAASLVGVAAVFAGGFVAGKQLQPAAPQTVVNKVVRQDDETLKVALELENTIAEQRNMVASARRDASERLRAMAMKVGQLQAQVIRVEALGQRVAGMARMDSTEFNFAEAPPLGGPESAAVYVDKDPLLDTLDSLDQQIDYRERQLLTLEKLLIDRQLANNTEIKGKPVEKKKGWMSSRFGFRTDPFTGRKTFHKGIDFAAPIGTDIVSVGGGVVTWAGDRSGYGILVEINHGDGYSTRYAHCKTSLVEQGDRVEPGQVVALVGMTGRSTGPHLHFEVWKDGQPINPIDYIRASR